MIRNIELETGYTKTIDERPGLNQAAAFIINIWPPATQNSLNWKVLAGDGSDRSFLRVRAGNDVAIVVHGSNPEENRAYEAIGRHLWQAGRFGPQFLATAPDRGLFLIEDLGDISLQHLATQAPRATLEAAYKMVIGLLADLQLAALTGFNPAWAFQTARYDRDLILQRETGYFMSAFIQGYLGMTADGPELAAEYSSLAEMAMTDTQTVFLHRDFQSRNIMIKDDRPRLIDFQGARLGPAGYDLASLLYDPYVTFDDRLRAGLLDHYLELRSKDRSGFDRTAFLRAFPCLAVCRLLQALGAYGFLSMVKNKSYFRAYVLPAVKNLTGLLGQESFDFLPHLRRLAGEILAEVEVRS